MALAWVFSILFWLLGCRGSVDPAKWHKPQKPPLNTNTMVNLALLPLVVLAILGFLFHRYLMPGATPSPK
jgi:hypothetical protein